MSSGTEKGTLSVIPEQKFIRRVYLNNRVVPMEIDLCSSVSVLTSDNPEISKRLEIIRKIEARPLGQKHQNNLGSHGCKAESVARERSSSHLNEARTGTSSDPSITFASDDPRRGGRHGVQTRLAVPPIHLMYDTPLEERFKLLMKKKQLEHQ